MEACVVKCSNGNALFRALKTPNFKLQTHALSSSSSSSLPISSGGGKSVGRAYDALLLDAGGTLLQLSKPVEETYSAIGRKYGVTATAADIKKGFKRAFAASWPEELRYKSWFPFQQFYQSLAMSGDPFLISESIWFMPELLPGCLLGYGDGRPFWKLVVSEATGCADDEYFEEVYEYYANGEAWHLPDGAHETLIGLREAGVKLAVVSNFDTRLRKLLKDLDVIDLFDALMISSEVGYEKPDPRIFTTTLDQLCVDPGNAVHVGDDKEADRDGANAVGITCWLWGTDVKTFADIKNRVVVSEY